MTKRHLALAASAMLLGCMLASAHGIQGPLSGYVFDDAAGQIRPIRGLPGGAVVGAPVPLPFLLKSASIAPSDYAITVAITGEIAVASGMDKDEVTITPINAAGINPDAVVLNDAGTAVALYWKDKTAAQLVTGLPGNPAAGALLDLSQIPGDILAIAADPAGSFLLVGAANSEGHGGIYRVTNNDSGTTVSFLAPAIRPSAIQFLHGGRDAVVADAGTQQILLIKSVATSAEESILAASSDGVDSVDRLAANDDQDYVLAASSQNAKLMIIYLQNGFVSRIEGSELPCVPSRLSKLFLPHLFVLSGPAPGPVQVLENSRGTNIYFVPPMMMEPAAQ